MIDKTKDDKDYQKIWNGKNTNGIMMQSGIYFAIINRESGRDVLKITFLK